MYQKDSTVGYLEPAAFGSAANVSGMAFAFEPKVVFPGEGAIGIENTFYLSNEGLKRLTHSSDELVTLS